jgi:hypothetical protein
VANQDEDNVNPIVDNYNGDNNGYQGNGYGDYYDSKGDDPNNNDGGYGNQSYQSNQGENNYQTQVQESYSNENQQNILKEESKPSIEYSSTADDELDKLKKPVEKKPKNTDYIIFDIWKKAPKEFLNPLNESINYLPDKQPFNDVDELGDFLTEAYMKIKNHQEFFDFAEIEKRTTYISNQNNQKLEKNHFLFFVCDYQIFSTNSKGGNFSYLVQLFNKNLFFINNLGVLKLNLIGRGSNIFFHSLSLFEGIINAFKVFLFNSKIYQKLFMISRKNSNIFNKDLILENHSSKFFNKKINGIFFDVENNQYKSLVFTDSNLNLLLPMMNDQNKENSYENWGISLKGDFFNNYKMINRIPFDMFNTFNEISLLLQSHKYLHQKFFTVMFNIHYSVIADIENFAGKKKKPLAEISMFFLFINSIKPTTFQPTEEFFYWNSLTYFQGDKIKIEFPLKKMYFFLGFQKNFFIRSKTLSSFIHNFFIYYIISPYELKYALGIFNNTMVGFSWGVKYFNINVVFYNYQINVHTSIQSGMVKTHPHQVQNFFMDGNLHQKNR